MHRSKLYLYSITLSARASSMGATFEAEALAVFRLMIGSNFGERLDSKIAWPLAL